MGSFLKRAAKREDQESITPQESARTRFVRRFRRDGWHWYFAGYLVIISALPYVAGLIFSIDNLSLFPMLITAPIGGMLAAPQLCGLADTLLRSFRDEEQDSWWKTYRKVWKRNWKATLLPGAIFGTISALQLFTLNYLALEGDFAMFVWVAFTVLITTPILSFLIVLLAVVEERFLMLVRNSVILCFHKPLRMLAALLVQLIYWGLICWFFPKSLPVFILTQFWLPTSVATALIYPPVEKAFDLEKRILEIHAQEDNTTLD